jgi:mannose-1-phosphate guanylyltransferase/mannose-1-phosphate guanylyltransferase/mannose-6-phosphate isomerase
MPKQFVPMIGGRSLFDLTLERMAAIPDAAAPIVVTGAAHLPLVSEAVADISGARVRVEPIGRNTAPAAIAAAILAGEGEVLLIVPSDHLISDPESFAEAVGRAAACAEEGGIVTFGITPSRPETGYGYIEIGEPGRHGSYAVERFKEKPDSGEAEAMAADGRHLWNSGMFLTLAGQLLAEAAAYEEDLVEGVRASLAGDHGEVIELGPGFSEVESISIDYAIMEKTAEALVVPLDVGWDDVGSYLSLLQALARDAKGNHVDGDVLMRDVSGSLVVATSRKVAVVGLSDYVVVETSDAVLVLPLSRSQEVKELAKRAEPD